MMSLYPSIPRSIGGQPLRWPRRLERSPGEAYIIRHNCGEIMAARGECLVIYICLGWDLCFSTLPTFYKRVQDGMAAISRVLGGRVSSLSLPLCKKYIYLRKGEQKKLWTNLGPDPWTVQISWYGSHTVLRVFVKRRQHRKIHVTT